MSMSKQEPKTEQESSGVQFNKDLIALLASSPAARFLCEWIQLLKNLPVDLGMVEHTADLPVQQEKSSQLLCPVLYAGVLLDLAGGSLSPHIFFADFMEYTEGGNNIQEMKIHTMGDLEPAPSTFEGRAKLLASMALNGAGAPCIALNMVPGEFVKGKGLQPVLWLIFT